MICLRNRRSIKRPLPFVVDQAVAGEIGDQIYDHREMFAGRRP
jgi:hypothetical protein